MQVVKVQECPSNSPGNEHLKNMCIYIHICSLPSFSVLKGVMGKALDYPLWRLVGPLEYENILVRKCKP